MSVAIMGLIFERQILPSSVKFVAVKMAEHANPEGKSIYPSIQRVAAECGLSRSTVRRAIRELIADGILELVEPGGAGSGSVNIYRLCIEHIKSLPVAYTQASDDGKRKHINSIYDSQDIKGVTMNPLPQNKGVTDDAKGVTDDQEGGHHEPQTVIEPSGTKNPKPQRGFPSEFTDFVDCWQWGELEDRTLAESEWDRLTVSDRKAALAHLPRFRQLHKKARPWSARKYLQSRCWQNRPAEAPTDRAPLPARSRVWYAYLFSVLDDRPDRDAGLRTMISAAANQGSGWACPADELPSEADQEKLIKIAVDGDAVKAWRTYLWKRGYTGFANDGAQWIWVPTEYPPADDHDGETP